MALIDAKALREYMQDYYGTAAFNGFPFAMGDMIALDQLSNEELCKKAEEMGIDLSKFVIDER